MDQDFFTGAFFVVVFFAGAALASLGGETKAIMDAPSSRVSTVVSMLGDVTAFRASFLILGEVMAEGAFGMSSFYGVL